METKKQEPTDEQVAAAEDLGVTPIEGETEDEIISEITLTIGLTKG